MATALSVFLAQVDALVSAGDDILAEASRNAMIKAALEQYSKDKPKRIAEDEMGDGGKYYVLAGTGAVLANWVDGFSRIIDIEYPAKAVSEDVLPQYLEPEDWRDNYYVASIRYLFFLNHAPAATETIRVTFTVPYEFANDPEDTDTPAQDFFAICNLSAAMVCEALAAKYSKTSDSTIGADAVGHPKRGIEYATRAQEFRTLYEQHAGLGEEAAVKAASKFADLDTAPGWPVGRQYVFHRNR